MMGQYFSKPGIVLKPRSSRIEEFADHRSKMADIVMEDASDMILPGELLSTVLSHPIKLCPDLRHTTSQSGETLIQATQAGLLQHKKQSTDYYIDYNSHRVAPSSQ